MNSKIISIEKMIKISNDCIVDLIEVGYMQASCNEERFVDFDDAVRIFIEDKFGILCNESYLLLSFLIHRKAEKRWNSEFENNVAM